MDQVEDYAALYWQAFEEFGVMALWNKRLLDDPTPEHALVIAQALRIEGNLDARRLAERIERACRASLRSKSRSCISYLAAGSRELRSWQYSAESWYVAKWLRREPAIPTDMAINKAGAAVGRRELRA